MAAYFFFLNAPHHFGVRELFAAMSYGRIGNVIFSKTYFRIFSFI